MTKSFSALLAAVVCAGLAHGAAAQSLPSGDRALTTDRGERPVSVFTQIPDRPLPVWAYTTQASVSTIDPVVISRSLDIALREGVLGWEVSPYRVSLPGPGYVGVIPAPVPEGWIVTRRCMERSDPSAHYPYGECHVYEMRELLGDPFSVAWD